MNSGELMSEKIIVKTGGEGFYEEKKSQFIAHVYSVADEAEAVAYIDENRKKYYDARHNCYAYSIGDNGEITKCSDDGEPSGTAGKPILEVITRNGIHNCLIVVTRYFGGTLLGTGGLVRAYTKSASDAIDKSELVTNVPGVRYIVDTDYTAIGKIQLAAEASGSSIINSEYTDKVRIIIDVPSDSADALCRQITENTAGKAVITKDCEVELEKNAE